MPPDAEHLLTGWFLHDPKHTGSGGGPLIDKLNAAIERRNGLGVEERESTALHHCSRLPSVAFLLRPMGYEGQEAKEEPFYLPWPVTTAVIGP